MGWMTRITASTGITTIAALAAAHGDAWFAVVLGFLAGASWTALLGMWISRPSPQATP